MSKKSAAIRRYITENRTLHIDSWVESKTAKVLFQSIKTLFCSQPSVLLADVEPILTFHNGYSAILRYKSLVDKQNSKMKLLSKSFFEV